MKVILRHLIFITSILIVFFTSRYLYLDAGEHLTPYSVSVSGYYRSDGTHVNSYSRRPPGGAKHDAPYETVRSITFFFMAGSVISLFYYGYCLYDNSTLKIKLQSKISKQLSHRTVINGDRNVDLINGAINNNQKICFSYTNRNGISSTRIVIPKKIYYYKNTLCLLGFCSKRKEDRSFAITRIYNLKLDKT